MIRKKTYLMLVVATFTFFGVEALNNIAHFSDYLSAHRIEKKMDKQEEEKESSGSEEVKEVKEQTDDRQSHRLIFSSVVLASIGHCEQTASLPNSYEEVVTPPPEV